MNRISKIGCLFVSLPFLVIAILAVCFAPFFKEEKLPNFDKREYRSPLASNCHTPLDMSQSFAAADATDSLTWLQLREASQSIGTYEIRFDYPSLPDGVMAIKCYDDTENTPMKIQLQAGLNPEVTGHTHFGTLLKSQLTIIESSARDDHVVRFEIWYKPNNASPRRLLIEKNFLVCGQTVEKTIKVN